MDAPRLLPLRFNVDVSAIVHSFLCEVEIVAFRIVRAESGKGTVRRTTQDGNVRIFLLDPRDRLFDIVDIDAEVMQPRDIAGFSTDYRHTNITIADTDRVIRPDRLFLFSGSRLGSFHAEHGFVELGLAHEVFTDNGSVLDLA